MKKTGSLLLICALALLLSTGLYAKEIEITNFLKPLEKDQIQTTETSILLNDPDLRAVHVSDIYFDDEDLHIRLHYTVSKTENGIRINLRDSFLRRQEHGKYPVYIVMVNHSAETVFTVGEHNSSVTQEPPSTRW